MIYINTALRCLRMMTKDDPVTNVIQSVEQILRAVERHINTINTSTPVIPYSPEVAPQSRSDIQFDPLEAPPAQSVEPTFFRDRYPAFDDGSTYDFGSDLSNTVNPLGSQFPLDIITTDLVNFFPIDMSIDSLNGHQSR